MKLIIENSDWSSIPALPPNFQMSSFLEATEITPSPSSTTNFTVDIKLDWAIQSIPHGGYLTSLATLSAQKYMQTQHPNLNQPDLIAFHVNFLSPSQGGRGTFSIHPLKTGRQFSTLRVQFLQESPKSTTPRICLEALITQGNLTLESKNQLLSLPTRPLAEKFSVPRREECERWITEPEVPSRRPAAFKIDMYLPLGSDTLSASPLYGPSVREQWVRWAPSAGTRFDVQALPFLGDAFRPMPEAYGLGLGMDVWYPTLSFGMEVKRSGEWEWLFFRFEMLEVRHGRFDVEMYVLDEDKNLVAVGRHTALILGSQARVAGAKI